MKKNPQSKLLEVIIPGYRMHTQMFDNALKAITEEDALRRIENKTNHIIWMAGNMVNCRYWLANVFGISDKDPNESLFAEGKALDTSLSYPSLENLKSEWHKISKLLYEKLLIVSDDDLHKSFDMGFNSDFIEENNLNMIGMCMDRISYLLGQIGLMRKMLNHTGTGYDINPEIDY